VRRIIVDAASFGVSSMKSAGVLIALFVLTSTAVHAQGLCRKPIYSKPPTPQAMAEVYPARAHRERLNGWAVLRCAQTASGRVENCEVRSESAPGYGFGAAALRLAPTLGGGGCSDEPDRIVWRAVEFPIYFRLPG
jgi:TonB family protein